MAMPEGAYLTSASLPIVPVKLKTLLMMISGLSGW